VFEGESTITKGKNNMESLLQSPSTYDSTADTLLHIEQVRKNIAMFVMVMTERAIRHDESKLGPEEKPYFDQESSLLKELVYDSPEYRESLQRLEPALKHHYAENSHHPEHTVNGVNGMDLFDVVEMLCDWMAAAKRNAGSGKVNMEANAKRFELSPQLAQILSNTIRRWPSPQ
jgi:hypothetical protein